jgi:CDP-diacylglycerol---glycerol-3-phosphate 3-phosphatidyltransferase
MQRVFAWPYRAILAGLVRLGVRPWELSLSSLALNVVAGVLLLRGLRLVPGLLLIPAGACDVFDGAVARQRGEESRWGAFLDAVLDRVSDLLLFGCLFWALARDGARVDAALALITLAVSLLVSQFRAEAEAASIDLTEGLFQRLERFLALIVGLVIPGTLRVVLVILAALGSFTALQRAWTALRRASGSTAASA